MSIFYNSFEIRSEAAEILITACKLMSVTEDLFLFLLIIMQEKLTNRPKNRKHFSNKFLDRDL